eukprot:g28457.t1
MWLLFIVEVISPNVIDIWEALVTFAMFPTLVTISWLANKGKIEFLALEKKRAEDANDGGSGSRRASVLDDDCNTAQKSHHPRLQGKMRASVAAVAHMGAVRKSHVSTEVHKEAAAGEEDKAIPAGSNGKVRCGRAKRGVVSHHSCLRTRHAGGVNVAGTAIGVPGRTGRDPVGGRCGREDCGTSRQDPKIMRRS